MATNTPNLNLLKKDPVTDGNETFNIQTMLNENWDKIDAAVGEMDIPDASLTAKGKVQLSNAIDGSREDVAATERAVKEVSDNLTAQLADLSSQAAGKGASLVGVAPISGLSGTNVQAMLQALFTLANNGKLDIASVIGFPATAADTFAQLKARIQTIKDSMATNLTDKGQASAGTEALAALVAKISNINTGARYATGTITGSGTKITISGLAFKPSTLILTPVSGIAGNWGMLLTDKRAQFGAAKLGTSTVANVTSFTLGTTCVVDLGTSITGVNYYWDAYE